MKKAWDLGINFFDTAELYGQGEGEVQMGVALKNLNVPREHYIVSTKLFWGVQTPSGNNLGLNRMHIKQGIKASLERMGLNYFDVVFCHRFDSETPVEEIASAFNDLVREGVIHYWGTSEWSAANIFELREACAINGYIRPCAE